MTAKTWRTLALATMLASTSATAWATDVFRLEGFGAVSRGLGGAAAAIDSGPSGVLTNPATLSILEDGDQFLIGFDLVTTNINITDTATGETAKSRGHSNNRGPYYAPELSLTKRWGRYTFGLGAYAQGGLGTEYGSSSFLSRATGGLDTGLSNSSRLLVLDIPLSASVKLTDKLAVGGSFDIYWQGLNLDLLLGANQVGSLIGGGRVSGTLLPVLGGLPDLRGAHFSLTKNQILGSGVDAWGYSGRIGAVYHPLSNVTLGAAYSFKTNFADLRGGATLTAIDGIAGQIALPGQIRIRDFQMPAHVDVGVGAYVTPQWLVTVDVSEVFWRPVFRNIDVSFTADNGAGIAISLPQNYRNQTIVALGTAYEITPKLTARTGVRLANQALDPQSLFAVIPATPKTHASFGLSYKLSNHSVLDFAYSHAFDAKLTNASLPNTSDPIQSSHTQNNFTVDYRILF